MVDKFMQAAIDEAKKGLEEGGIPIGSVLVINDKIVGRGHNRRVQKGSAILHAEMDCFENAGRLKARLCFIQLFHHATCAAEHHYYIISRKLLLEKIKHLKVRKII
jgi:tRNA(Arg) A34 adenosine deaminase TadA